MRRNSPLKGSKRQDGPCSLAKTSQDNPLRSSEGEKCFSQAALIPLVESSSSSYCTNWQGPTLVYFRALPDTSELSLTVQKKAIFVWKKKFVQRGSPEKKFLHKLWANKKNSCKRKIPPPPHHFSNGPSLMFIIFFLFLLSPFYCYLFIFLTHHPPPIYTLPAEKSCRIENVL